MRNTNRLPVERPGSNADFYPFGGFLRSEVEVMNADERHAGETAKTGGARALAGVAERGAVAYLTRWTGADGRDELRVHANEYRARGYAEEVNGITANYGLRRKVYVYCLFPVGCVADAGTFEERGIA